MKKSSYRSTQDVDSWRAAELPVDRYAYSGERERERYHRAGAGDDYDVPVNNWAPGPGASRFPNPRDEWSATYAPFPGTGSGTGEEYPSRNGHSGYRPQDDGRGRAQRRTNTHTHKASHQGEDMDQWRRGGGGENPQVWERESDSGWLPRRRTRPVVEPPPPPPPPLPLPAPDDDEDRKWEPAPSWKSTHRERERDDGPSSHNYSRTQNGTSSGRSDHSYSHKTSSTSQSASKNGKKTSSQHSKGKYAAESDWRSRDESSEFNNWTRRSSSSKNEEPEARHKSRKHSPTRHRSPDSVYSHHSRGRSLTPVSPPPTKRRKYEDDSPRYHPASQDRRYSDSPSSPRHHERSHRKRRSISSVSSRSTRSPSPIVAPRAVHRLPSPSAPIISFPPAPAASLDSDLVQRRADTSSKKKKKNKNANKHRNGNGTMPPPSTLPASIPPRPTFTQDADPARQFVPKMAFKPIAANQNSNLASSLKKFFPGDDEDMNSPRSSVAPHPAFLPPPPAAFIPPPSALFPPSSVPFIPPSSVPFVPPSSVPFIPPSPVTFVPPSSVPLVPPPVPLAARLPPPSARLPEKPPGLPEKPPPQVFGAMHPGQPLNSVSPRWTSRPTPDVESRPSRSDEWANSPKLELEPESVKVPTPSPTPRTRTRSPSSSPMDIDPPDHPTPTSMTTELSLYHFISQVGEGTFGKVYKVLNTQTGVHVALKRIRMEAEKDGFPVTAMREIKLLQSLTHDNVVRLFEMLVSSGSVYMVFEYMDHDLTGILSQSQFSFSPAHLKSLNQQMLSGLAYLHHKGVIHRDIKGSNILLNNRGELKLADFGLARFYQKRRRTDYTNRVITLWYRPPELLFGATVYGPEVDMWSAGCIMLELYTKKPVFQGNDEIHQLDTIYRIIGTPDVERWPDIGNLPWYELVKPKERVGNQFREVFAKWMSGPALDLAERLLDYDPLRRISAADALEAPYFVEEEPKAERPVRLATVEGEWHELETKRERAKKRKKD